MRQVLKAAYLKPTSQMKPQLEISKYRALSCCIYFDQTLSPHYDGGSCGLNGSHDDNRFFSPSRVGGFRQELPLV